MRRGNYAHIRCERFNASNPLETPLLKYTQELYLHIQRHIADLIEKQRASIGKFEASTARRDRTGERPFFMAE